MSVRLQMTYMVLYFSIHKETKKFIKASKNVNLFVWLLLANQV